VKPTDPARATPEQRLAAIAELLAVGFQRHLARGIKSIPAPQNQQDQLDVLGPGEAPCASMPPEAE
jgi:hypothetical protein